MKDKTKQKILKEHYAKIASKGGKARAKKLSPERRSEIASMGGKAHKLSIEKLSVDL